MADSSQPSLDHTQKIEENDDPNSADDLDFSPTEASYSALSYLRDLLADPARKRERAWFLDVIKRDHRFAQQRHKDRLRCSTLEGGVYFRTNYDRERDLLDLNHHIFRLSVGGALFRARVDPCSARILDIGTGTGIWAVEMANEYPQAEVIGTDLRPIQAGWLTFKGIDRKPLTTIPPNCFFKVGDFESDWDFSKPFDFIHARALSGSVRDFPGLFQRIMNNLKPGGWVEVVDFPMRFFSDDGVLQDAPNLVEWARLHVQAIAMFRRDMDVAHNHKQWLIDAGFKNVKEEIYKVPLTPWANDPKMKRMGRDNYANMVGVMEMYSFALFTRVLGWSIEKTEAFLTGVKRELTEGSHRCYAKYYFVYGRKEK